MNQHSEPFTQRMHRTVLYTPHFPDFCLVASSNSLFPLSLLTCFTHASTHATPHFHALTPPCSSASAYLSCTPPLQLLSLSPIVPNTPSPSLHAACVFSARHQLRQAGLQYCYRKRCCCPKIDIDDKLY